MQRSRRVHNAGRQEWSTRRLTVTEPAAIYKSELVPLLHAVRVCAAMQLISTSTLILATALCTVCCCSFMRLRGDDAQPSKPSLDSIPSAERAMIESACRTQRMFRGPAAYYNCVREQLSAVQTDPGMPSLAGISSAERAMIESACRTQRMFHGPAAYYSCVREQLSAVEAHPGAPSFAGVSSADQAMIESACRTQRMFHGPSAYYSCLREQLAAAEADPGIPSLADVSSADQTMIESACRTQRMFHGPAAYYNCFRQQLAALSGQGNGALASSSGSDVHRVARSQTISQKSRGTPSPGSKRNQSSGKVREAPRQQGGEEPQAPKAAPPSTTTPTRPTRYSPPPASSPSADGFIVIVVAAILIGLVFKVFHGLQKKKCARCGSLISGTGTYCPSCVATTQGEERRAHAQRQAEEQAKADERRRQRERSEEEARRRLRTLDELHKLTGPKFEELIASLFKRDGYLVHRCGGSGDEGIDLILEMAETRDVVQCKRWKADVGSPVVRDFYGALMHANARHGFIITTASFSQSARAFARGKPISLISGSDILRWIDGVYSSRASRQHTQSAKSEAPNGFDAYVVLGVGRNASKEDIRAAYRREMASYHPDKVAHLGGELQELAKRKAQAINRAYEELINST
jgi:uncharacterized Zn finger protein (UPF0148 family)